MGNSPVECRRHAAARDSGDGVEVPSLEAQRGGRPREIRRLRAEGFPTGELASRFGVTYENVLAIVCRRSWKHLP